MPRRHTLLIFCLFICCTQLYAQANVFTIKHSAYSLLYDEATEQAIAVRYELNQTVFKNGTLPERDTFKEDPKVPTQSASPEAYAKSNYDRGHLAPFSSFRGIELGAKESFYMSNMSPQIPKFNRVFWVKVEDYIYDQLDSHPNLIIFTGPLIIRNGPLITVNGVVIPDMFYKVVIDADTKQEVFSLLVPHEDITDNPYKYIVPKSYIELLLKRNFDTLDKQLKLP